ncbi:ORF1a polyprotein [Common moorhen coronavirus HKU21]|uniref:ORF1a polyprotein n=1 Tax=Common moorhen coronavirus HKU21 TaxID=1159902 RepID=UPI001E1C0744|nr:ORF1a polyprotein [Common moorhen coronavirus HKU21]
MTKNSFDVGKVITLPKVIPPPLQLFIAVAAADEGHPNKLNRLAGYTLRTGNVVPGVQVLDPKTTLTGFETIFGVQPTLRAIGNLLESARTDGWVNSKDFMAVKAKELTFTDDVLRVMIRHGAARIPFLASLALFYRLININVKDLYFIAEDVARELAYSADFSTVLADVKTIECIHTDGYLTININKLGNKFTSSLVAQAEPTNGSLTFGNFVLWPRATAIKVNDEFLPFAGKAITATQVGNPYDEDVNLLPDYQQLPVDVVEGTVVTVRGYKYIKTTAAPPLYYPIVKGGVLPVALKQQGSASKKLNVVFHASPNDVLLAFIQLQEFLNRSTSSTLDVVSKDVYEVAPDVTVTIGPSKPGDIVVHDDEEYLKCFLTPDVPLLYKVFQTESWAKVAVMCSNIRVRVSDTLTGFLTFLQCLCDKLPTLVGVVNCIIQALEELSLFAAAKISNIRLTYKAGSLVVDAVSSVATLCQPLLDFLTPFLSKVANFATYAVGNYMLMFTSVGTFLLNRTKICANKIRYAIDYAGVYPVVEAKPKIQYCDGLTPVHAKPKAELFPTDVVLDNTIIQMASDGQHLYMFDGTQAHEQAFLAGVSDDITVSYVCDVFSDEVNEAINSTLSSYELNSFVVPSDATAEFITQQCIASLVDAINDYHPEYVLSLMDDLQVCSSFDDLPLASHHIPDKLELYVQALDNDDSDDINVDEDDCHFQDTAEDDGGVIPTCWVIPEIPSFTKADVTSVDVKPDEKAQELDSTLVQKTVIVERFTVHDLKAFDLKLDVIPEESDVDVNSMETSDVCSECSVEYYQDALDDDTTIITDESDVVFQDELLATVVNQCSQVDNNIPEIAKKPNSPTVVELVVADLKTLKYDNSVLVNPANEYLRHGGGAAAAIAKMAGPDYVKYCDEHAPFTGVLNTPAFDAEKLGVACILHVVPPRGTDSNVQEKLYLAYKSLLVEPAHYVIPILGAGIFGCNPVHSLDAFRKACPPNIGKVTLVTQDDRHLQAWDAINRVVVQTTKDFDQVTTQHLTPQGVLDANLYDGHDFVLEPKPNHVYLAVDDVIQTAANDLDLTLSQYCMYLKNCQVRWTTKRVKGLVHLQQQSNNCFVSSALNFYQNTHYKFRPVIDALYQEYLNGNPSRLVAWIYASISQSIGELGCPQQVLNLLVLNSNSKFSGVTHCCKRYFTHDGVVANVEEFDLLQSKVYCVQCECWTTFDAEQTEGVITVGRTSGPAPTHAIMFGNAHCWYTDGRKSVNGYDIQADVVAIYHKFNKVPEQTAMLAQVFETSNKYEVLKVDPVINDDQLQDVVVTIQQPAVPKCEVLQNPNTIDLLDVWIRKPTFLLVKSWSVIGKTLFKAGKVVFLSTRILNRIYEYLCQIGAVDRTAKLSFNLAYKCVKSVCPKPQTVGRVVKGMFYSFRTILLAMAPLLLLPAVTILLRAGVQVFTYYYAKTGWPCNYNGTIPYDYQSFCVGQPLTCMACFDGYDSLHLYQHLHINQVPVKDIDYTTIAAFIVLLVANATLALVTTIIIFCVNFYKFTLPFYGVVILDYYNTLTFVFGVSYTIRLIRFFRHVSKGCKSPTCTICSRIRTSPTITVETIVQGRKYPSTIITNEGSVVCKQHNFYCKNCDAINPDTFIPVEAVESLAKVTKLDVKSTAPAYVLARDVECQSDAIVARAIIGGTHKVCVSKYSDVRTVEALLKPVPLYSYTSDVIIAVDFDNSGSLRTAKELAVVLSMDLKRTIFIIDQHYSRPIDNYTEVCSRIEKYFTINKITPTGDIFVDVRNATNGQVTDSAINAAIIAVERGLDFTIDEPNHVLPHYAFDFSSLSVEDQSVLLDMGCVKGNLKGTNVGVVLTANLVTRLTQQALRVISNAASRNGVTCSVTPSTRVLRGNIVTQPFARIKAGKFSNQNVKLIKLFAVIAFVYVVAFATFYVANGLTYNTVPTVKSDIKVSGFYLIRDGVLDTIRAEDDCFMNKFLAFDSYIQKPYVNSPQCPIVVGIADVTGLSLPGIPAGVIQRDGLILHIYEQSLYDKLLRKSLVDGVLNIQTRNLFNIGNKMVVGYTQHEVVTGDSYLYSPALFNAKCTFLLYNNNRTLYCYDKVDVPHKLYSDVIPHVEYKAVDLNGDYVPFKIPEQLFYYPHVVRYVSNNYCRMGHCFRTDPGVCVSFVDAFPYTQNDVYGVYCASNGYKLVTNLVLGTITGIHVFTSTAALLASTGVIIFCVIFALSFQRLFKEYTVFVVTTLVVAVFNIIGIFLFYKITLLAIVYYVVYVYIALLAAPVKRNIALFYLCVVFIPHITNMQLLCLVICGFLYVVYNYVYIVTKTKGKFSSFLDAAKSTFVIDNDKYVLLKDLAGPDYDQYLASYVKYKYFTGTASDKDYDKVCMAFLAKAMSLFREGGGTQLYTPPKLAVVQSIKIKLQAGIKILLHPSGMVERCMTSVTYNGSTLNGVWLHNIVYCPRHVIGKYTGDQWQLMVSILDCNDFIIKCPTQGIQLTVQSVKMVGAVLQLTVHSSNAHTPKYEFTRLTPGASMTIACAYDGIVRNVYHVVLHLNNLIYASFLNGACGSVGYTVKGATLHLHYMHHLEFNNQTHGGTDFHGVFYGPYIDEEIAQQQMPTQYFTDNVVAQIYAHLLTIDRSPKWLARQAISDEEFNRWAVNNAFANYPCDSANLPYLTGLAETSKVSIGRVLNTIIQLTLNRDGALIMGHPDFECDWTPQMVFNQAPINLQASVVSTCFNWCLVVLFNMVLFALALIHILPVNMYVMIPMIAGCTAFIVTITIKHTVVFLTTFLLPTLVLFVVLAPTIWVPNTYLRYIYEWIIGYTTYDNFTSYTFCLYMLVYIIVAINFTLRNVRYKATSLVDFCLKSLQYGYTLRIMYRLFTETWDEHLLFPAVALLSSHPMYAAICWKLAGKFILPLVIPDLAVRICVYFLLGYISCMRFGIFWFINKFLALPIGTYKYMVSMDQLKYMMATKMSPPHNVFEVMTTNIRLFGIGGHRNIAISTVQNRVLDAKATAVIVANLLEKAGVTNKHVVCKKIVKLHNDTLKAATYEEAETALVKLLAHIIEFLPSEQVDEYLSMVNKPRVLDEYMDVLVQNKFVLQAVVDANIHMDSYRIFKEAEQAYKKSVELNEPIQEQKKKLKAVNIAKSEWERDAASQKKLEKLADAAMKSMYLAERAEDRRIKLTSGLTAMLYHMLRRIDSDKVKALFECAKQSILPIHAVVGVSSDALKVIFNDKESYMQYITGNILIYKGVSYNILKVTSLDNSPIEGIPEEYPVVVETIKVGIPNIQNNELCLRNVFTAQNVAYDINGKEETTKSFYVSRTGKKILVAITSTKDNLQTVVCHTDTGKTVLDLDPPMRFSHVVGGKQSVVYLYFIRNISSLNRGMVIGHISGTTILQATGTHVEYQENASLLTYLAFAVNPKEAYLKHVADGGKPIQGVIQMIAPIGSGFAVTTKPQPNEMQYSYGGASVCLYCRAHITHPGVDGRCVYKGRFVHIDKDKEPVSFALTHEPCNSCQRWLNYDCTCGSVLQNTAYLNE